MADRWRVIKRSLMEKEIMIESSIRTDISKRTDYIDVARGVMIILMLVGHSGLPQLGRQLIYGFHMPFFFIISGVMYNKEKWGGKIWLLCTR